MSQQNQLKALRPEVEFLVGSDLVRSEFRSDLAMSWKGTHELEFLAGSAHYILEKLTISNINVD
jgi:hypothetical protein